MKYRIICTALVLCLLITTFAGCKNKNTDKTDTTVTEEATEYSSEDAQSNSGINYETTTENKTESTTQAPPYSETEDYQFSDESSDESPAEYIEGILKYTLPGLYQHLTKQYSDFSSSFINLAQNGFVKYSGDNVTLYISGKNLYAEIKTAQADADNWTYRDDLWGTSYLTLEEKEYIPESGILRYRFSIKPSEMLIPDDSEIYFSYNAGDTYLCDGVYYIVDTMSNAYFVYTFNQDSYAQ